MAVSVTRFTKPKPIILDVKTSCRYLPNIFSFYFAREKLSPAPILEGKYGGVVCFVVCIAAAKSSHISGYAPHAHTPRGDGEAISNVFHNWRLHLI